MSKYRVMLSYTATKYITVEADSAEEAKYKVCDESYVCLCQQCADEIEIDDNGTVESVEELEDE